MSHNEKSSKPYWFTALFVMLFFFMIVTQFLVVFSIHFTTIGFCYLKVGYFIY